ncbi:hypothetical protein O6H91_07G087600 [Diphasiastrum complanatum]|uniref:Uncharacterized protein n=1 Tax=Diphasiastrum complanatum TaxID=34168 RepID=A0ACC2D7U9_DIPCM|nr:hypothetical protein O6H91_07G087600 [Diphasiastrum complanatum]
MSSSKASRSSSSSSSLIMPPQAEAAAAAGDVVKQVAISTTFVQAHKESFREVVQKYTGAGDASQGKLPITSKPISCGGWIGSEALLPRKPSSHKLHERRQKSGGEMKLEIRHNPFFFKRNGASPRSSSDGLSPISRDHLLPPLLSSPVTPLSALSLDSSPSASTDHLPLSSHFIKDENQVNTFHRCSLFAPLTQQQQQQRKGEPELLNLFPLTSPHMT